MSINGYLDSDVQKAFLPSVPRVSEHQCKLATIITAARKSKQSLSVAWLDIANAYGSIHHSLIQFAMSHYYAPTELCHLLQSWYTGLSATVSTQEGMTPAVPLEIGVYQGDPLSVVIFLTVMATLSDTLSTRYDLGVVIPKLKLSVNHLLYADDTCIVSSSPAGCQHLLDIVQQWLVWAPGKSITDLSTLISRSAILGYFKILCCRNHV